MPIDTKNAETKKAPQRGAFLGLCRNQHSEDRERVPFKELVLLRKEVIQPHLPVRLPCYDFVPIANPTLDSSLPCGLGHWLHVLPTFRT